MKFLTRSECERWCVERGLQPPGELRRSPGSSEYLSYDFSNMSTDIVLLFRDACDLVGVYTRATRSPRGTWRVRINQRARVALMRERVGLKA